MKDSDGRNPPRGLPPKEKNQRQGTLPRIVPISQRLRQEGGHSERGGQALRRGRQRGSDRGHLRQARGASVRGSDQD